MPTLLSSRQSDDWYFKEELDEQERISETFIFADLNGNKVFTGGVAEMLEDDMTARISLAGAAPKFFVIGRCTSSARRARLANDTLEDEAEWVALSAPSPISGDRFFVLTLSESNLPTQVEVELENGPRVSFDVPRPNLHPSH